MSKIPRFTQQIFAASAANVGEFGTLQLGTKVLSTNPANIQTSAWVQGWSAAVVSGQNLPSLEEMNGINLVTTSGIAYLFQEGIAEYDAGTTYFQHSIVKAPGTYQVYGSKIDTNLGNALTNTTDWQFLCDLSNPESNIVWGGTAGGSASALTLTPTSPLASYITPTIALFLPASNSVSGGTTINISGLGAKNITKGGTIALAPNDLEAGKLAMAIYDGTQFQLINIPAFAHGADVASASTLILNATGGDIVNITGTTTVTAVTLNEGRFKVCKFAGAVTLTYGASLLLNTGAANYTTAANDVVFFYGLASGVVVGTIIPASGKAVVSPAAATTSVAGVVQLAQNSDLSSASSTTLAVTPATVVHHPGVAKAWANFVGSSGSINASYNISSITRNGPGDYTVAFTTALSNANYAVSGMAVQIPNSANSGVANFKFGTTLSSGSFNLATNEGSAGLLDSPYTTFIVHGNQ